VDEGAKVVLDLDSGTVQAGGWRGTVTSLSGG
jgi:hypothetical protein